MAVWSMAVGAAELNYSLGYQAEHSSNIRRAPTAAEEDTISAVTASVSYREESRVLRAQLAANSQYRDYRNDTFEDEAVSFLDGTLLWTISPNLSWTVADSFRNVPAAQTLADTPANRENTNVFSTGPTAQWRITPVDTLVADARYGRLTADTTDIDNDRHSGALRWVHRRSATTDVSLNYEQLRVDFDNDALNRNYRRQDMSIRGQVRPGRTAVALELGASDIDRDGLPGLDGSLVRFTVAREISSVRRMGVIVSSEYSDTAIALSPSGISSLPSGTFIAPEALTADVYYDKRIETYIESTAGIMPWGVRAFRREADYETTANDVEQSGGRVDIGLRRSSYTGMAVFSNYVRSDHLDAARLDRDVENGVRFNVRLRQSLDFQLQASRIERRSSDPTQSFVDDRVLAAIIYRGARVWRP